MKLFFSMLLSFVSLAAYSQSDDPMLKGLKKNKAKISGTSCEEVKKEEEKGTVEVKVEQDEMCNQPSAAIPYSFLSALLLEDTEDLKIEHNPRTMNLSVRTGSMISNCSNMIELNVVESQIGSDAIYGIKAKIKDCPTKDEFGKCSYEVFKRANGTTSAVPVSFSPTFIGFKECLRATGVINEANEVVSDAIHKGSKSLNHKLKESGRVMFVSHGIDAANYSPLHDKSYEKVKDCNYFENIVADGKEVKSQSEIDEEAKAANIALIQAEAGKHKDKCTVADYLKISESFDKFDELSEAMIAIRDPLIRLAAKDLAKLMTDSKYELTDSDMKVIADFNKYIVQEQVNKARELYDDMQGLEGTAREDAKKELAAIKADIKSLNGSPYFTKAMVDKLVKDGKFDEARTINSMKLTLQHHVTLGDKIQNVVTTPDLASKRITSDKLNFDADLEIEKERYAYRTGEESGLADFYKDLTVQMRENITARSQNYSEELRAEAARMTPPSGYCFRYFRNTQKCIADSQERILELQSELAHYNKVDGERAVEYDEKYKDYEALETEGRTYLANSGAEGGPATTNTSDREVASDTRVAPSTSAATTFDYNQPAPYQQQQYAPTNPYVNNNMFQQPQNPWGQSNNQQYQAPWLGQQSYQYNLNGNSGMQNGMYQQQYNQGYTPFGGMGGMGGTSFQYNSGMQQQPFGGQPFGQQQYGQFGQQQQQYYGGNQYMPPQYQMYR